MSDWASLGGCGPEGSGDVTAVLGVISGRGPLGPCAVALPGVGRAAPNSAALVHHLRTSLALLRGSAPSSPRDWYQSRENAPPALFLYDLCSHNGDTASLKSLLSGALITLS